MASEFLMSGIISGDLFEVLTGQDGYAVTDPYGDTPTEAEAAFMAVLNAFPNNAMATKELLNGILEVSRTPDYSWFSIYYLSLALTHRKALGAEVDIQAFADEVLTNIRGHEAYLRQLKRWEGNMWPDGCWGAVVRMVNQMKKYQEKDGIVIHW
jgi:hypothetical protein